ncbi:IncHI-type conjugal transfer helicase TrhI [soil metagenome]
MPDFFSDLNEGQHQAASCETHCLTIAAPGSGKTKMLSAKASYLLSRNKTVTAVTFTRDSALELRNRIVKQVGIDVMPRLLVGTFHSIDLLMAFPGKAKSAMGSEILKHSRSSLSQSWVIVKEGNRRSAVARAFDAAAVPGLELDDATALIEGIKSGQVAPKCHAEELLVKTYTDVLERHGVIDFQDILLKTNEAIKEGRISTLKTDYLLLDEYQDTDLPQLTWIMHHAKTGSIITAVGDDDQSIYGFRRALGFGGMLSFENDLRATRVVLGLNYRSHSEVLEPSAKLIAVNLNRMDKALVSNKGPGGATAWERFASRKLEAIACAQTIRTSLGRKQTVGVLARTNKRLDEIETQCIALEIPYSRSAGGSVLKTREMSVFMAALNCMTRSSAKDTDELLAWCGIDEQDLTALYQTFGDGLFNVTRKRSEIGTAAIKDTTKLLAARLAKSFSDWKAFIRTGGSSMVVDGVVQLLSSFTEDKFSKKMLEVVAGVLTPAANETVALSNAQEHFENRLNAIRAAMERPGTKKDEADKPVVLMTAHGSKGLEFDMVWVIGAEEDTFPDKASSVQEERRLFYVAMTRARKHLWISASGKLDVSRFVFESGVPRVPDGTFQTYDVGP